MNTEKNKNVYVKVKDMAGNDFVCPLNELRDAKTIGCGSFVTTNETV
ncbi:MAG: hypothetical protein WBM78_23970 [Desulfobacterales bacterium]